MSALTAFLDDVLPDLPDCLNKIMVDAIRQSAIRFCESAYIIEATLADVVLSTGVSEYTLSHPANQRIVMIKGVFDALGNELPNIPIYKMSPNTSGIKPTFWGKVNTQTIRPYPTPSTDGDILTVKAVVKPSQTCDVVDDILFEDYRMAIAAGAKLTLVAMPNKEWTNIQMVPYYQSIFDDGVSEARYKIAMNHVGERHRVKPVRFR